MNALSCGEQHAFKHMAMVEVHVYSFEFGHEICRLCYLLGQKNIIQQIILHD